MLPVRYLGTSWKALASSALCCGFYYDVSSRYSLSCVCPELYPVCRYDSRICTLQNVFVGISVVDHILPSVELTMDTDDLYLYKGKGQVRGK